MTWYATVTADISKIPDFVEHFNSELEGAKRDVIIHGVVEKSVAALPGVVEHRFNQLQEIEAVLRYLELQLKKLRRKHFQKYMEGYQRALTSRDAEKYTEGEEEVVDFEVIINDIALIRNKWLGVIKGLDNKSFMLGHLCRLKTAGMEDYTL